MKQLQCFWSFSDPKEDEKEAEKGKNGWERRRERRERRVIYSPPFSYRKVANLHLGTEMEAVAQTATASRGNVDKLNLVTWEADLEGVRNLNNPKYFLFLPVSLFKLGPFTYNIPSAFCRSPRILSGVYHALYFILH